MCIGEYMSACISVCIVHAVVYVLVYISLHVLSYVLQHSYSFKDVGYDLNLNNTLSKYFPDVICNIVETYNDKERDEHISTNKNKI